MTYRLTDEDRAALAEYVADALTFAAGASAECVVGVRSDGPDEWAREFVGARLPVEVEAIVARAVEAAKAEAWQAGAAAGHHSPLTWFALRRVNPYRAALGESRP